MRFSIALGTIEPKSGASITFLHLLELLKKFLKLRSSHILPVPLNHIESNWRLGADKWEWKCVIKCGVGKFVDSSGKRIGGFGRIRMLVGKFVDSSGKRIGGFGRIRMLVGKFVDSSGKRIGGFGRIRMLVGRAVNVCNYLLDAPPSLASLGGKSRRGILLTIYFRRDGWLRCVCFIRYIIVSWLSICYIEDVFTLPLSAGCLVR